MSVGIDILTGKYSVFDESSYGGLTCPKLKIILLHVKEELLGIFL